MTDASVEQGKRKRCKEHSIVPESLDSSSRSSSRSSTLSENHKAEGCRRGGPATLDLTMSDFNKADCRTTCRNLVETRNRLC